MRNVVFSCALVAAVGCATVPPPTYEIKLPERHTQLANGMRVILLPDTTSPFVEVDVHVEAGGNEDPNGKAGLAHLAEHLMFDQRPAGPTEPGFGAVLGQHALAWNAFTVEDYTHYYTIARPEELSSLLAMEATRLATGCRTIDQLTFEREREVVRNEIRLRWGTPEAQAHSLAKAIVYPAGHPYGRSVGGDDTQIASITLEDACRFFEDYYTPGRTTLIIAGNVVEAQAAAAIDRTLAPLPARAAKPRVEVPPIQLQPKVVTIEADVDRTSVYGLWALPPLYTREDNALGYIVGSIAGSMGAWGSLNELIWNVGVDIFGGPKAPVMAIRLELRDDKDPEEAIAMFKRNAGHADYGMNDHERDFERDKKRRVGMLTLDMESLSKRTVSFAAFAQFDPQGKFFAGELERSGALTYEELRATIRRVLDPDKAEFVIVVPKRGEGLYGRANLVPKLEGAASTDELPVDRTEASRPIDLPADLGSLDEARRFQLGNGLKVVLLPTHEPMPIMSAAIVFNGGRAQEPHDKTGLCEVITEYLGTPVARDYVDNRAYGLDDFGITYDADCGNDFTTFRVRGLVPYQRIMLEGMAKMFDDPTLPAAGFWRIAEARERQLKRPGQYAIEIARKRRADLIYGADHPYAQTVMSTKESLHSIGGGDVKDFAHRYFVAANATLIVTGRFDPATAEVSIREKFAALDAGTRSTATIPPARERSGPAYIGVEGTDVPVTQISLAYPARGSDSSLAARLVLASMLNHRVAAVRDKLGASYGMYARYVRHLGPSHYAIEGSVDAERGGEALAAIRKSIDGLLTGDGVLEEFVRARRQVLRELVTNSNDSQSLASRLIDIAGYQMSATAIDDLSREVAKLSPKAVLALINTDLKPAGEVIVAVGGVTKLKRMFEGAGVKGVEYEAQPVRK